MAGSTIRRSTIEKAIHKTLAIAAGSEQVHSGQSDDVRQARQRAQAMRFALACLCRELGIPFDGMDDNAPESSILSTTHNGV